MKQVCKAVLFAFLGVSGMAQESATPRIVIPLIANGSHHRPISVAVGSLVITDQGIQVTGASLLRGADLPVELGILIDVSNSQRGAHLDYFLKGTTEFVNKIIRVPEDRVFLSRFDATLQATGWLNKEQLQGQAVNLSIGGPTALYDALATACKQRMGPRDWRKPTRRILLLISDGEDNLSHITRDDAASEALKSGAVIFTIDTDLSGMSYKGVKVMENFAKLTGGESFTQVDGKDIPKVFASIQDLIDGMYYLAYVPPDASKSAVHEVEVKPAPKEKFKLSYARKYLWNP